MYKIIKTIAQWTGNGDIHCAPMQPAGLHMTRFDAAGFIEAETNLPITKPFVINFEMMTKWRRQTKIVDADKSIGIIEGQTIIGSVNSADTIYRETMQQRVARYQNGMHILITEKSEQKQIGNAMQDASALRFEKKRGRLAINGKATQVACYGQAQHHSIFCGEQISKWLNLFAANKKFTAWSIHLFAGLIVLRQDRDMPIKYVVGIYAQGEK